MCDEVPDQPIRSSPSRRRSPIVAVSDGSFDDTRLGTSVRQTPWVAFPRPAVDGCGVRPTLPAMPAVRVAVRQVCRLTRDRRLRTSPNQPELVGFAVLACADARRSRPRFNHCDDLAPWSDRSLVGQLLARRTGDRVLPVLRRVRSAGSRRRLWERPAARTVGG